MLYNESLWFKSKIEEYVQPNSIVLNIGSQTLYFRTKQQPFVQKNLFDVLQKLNCKVIHVDLQSGEGIDEVGDVTSPSVIERLKKYNANVLICSNLLEHLEERSVFCNALTSIMPINSLLFFSGPFEFPYHEDPIDTMFRPTVDEVKQEFKQLELVEGMVVKCGKFSNLILQKLLNNEPFSEKIKSAIKNVGFLLTSKKNKKVESRKYSEISAICCILKKI